MAPKEIPSVGQTGFVGVLRSRATQKQGQCKEPPLTSCILPLRGAETALSMTHRCQGAALSLKGAVRGQIHALIPSPPLRIGPAQAH